MLRSSTHLPPGWDSRFGTTFAWTWCFHLTDLPGDRSRIHLRVRGRSAPWWFTALSVGALVPADLIMAMGMLRGLKQRAESDAPLRPSGRDPFNPDTVPLFNG